MEWLDVGELGLVAVQRMLAVGSAEAAPMKRLMATTPEEKLIVLTGGRKRRTVLVLDTGHLVITSLSLVDVVGELQPTTRVYLPDRDSW